ncbi:hypothetical protein SUGI_0679380 [Cryptomeria japonica]|nr:hypothetical protein SUGI_0679380 [Cryptomeria japonica]
MEDGIFIFQSKYVKEVLKTFGMEDSKPVGTPMVTGCKLTKDDDSTLVDEKEYRSMIGKLHYVVHSRLDIAHAVGITARFQKSPRESHLIVVNRFLGNVDDRKSTTGGAFFLGGRLIPVSEPVSIFCDNTSAINISKNPVLHSRTKHFELKYHFLTEKVQNKEIALKHVSSKEQLADIFTKPLPKTTFVHLRGELGVFPL